MSTEVSLAALEKGLAELRDREAIRELAARYCHCAQRGDAEAIVALFTEDGAIDMGETAIRGREQLLRSYRDAFGDMRPIPFIHNHVVELAGERARGTCSVEIRLVQNGEAYTAAGHYDDTYRRVDGAWKFERRQLIIYHWVPLAKGWA
jgi:ketosteroid isomerase-like protein